MADIITLSSSEDESVQSPPKKRIKPTPIPVLKNLPHVTITKVTKPKKDTVVVLCSDDDDDNDDDEVTCIDAQDAIEIEKRNEERQNGDNVLKISASNEHENGSNSSVEEILNPTDDVDIYQNHSELIKDLEGSCEIINEDSCEESSGKENRALETAIKDSIQPCSSKTAGKPANTVLLGNFIKIIDDQTKEEEKYKVIKDKFPLLWKYYNECEEQLGESNSFKNLLLSNIQKAEKSMALSVISFNDIFQHLKESANAECIEVEKEHLMMLKKLEKTIKRLVVMIKQLEEEEIDFDEEEDSSYLKLERYINRLNKVYKKYCDILKKNPYSGRLTYSKLDFVDSKYNEINRAISKKYKNNKKFPSYHEMEKFIEKVSKETSLDLNESKIKAESVHCFKRLGELLQNRRRKELYDVHHMYIKDGDDPAKEDAKLNEVLKSNYQDGQSKIDKLVQDYVQKESVRGEHPEPAGSSESDESNYVDSEDDEGDEDKGRRKFL